MPMPYYHPERTKHPQGGKNDEQPWDYISETMIKGIMHRYKVREGDGDDEVPCDEGVV